MYRWNRSPRVLAGYWGLIAAVSLVVLFMLVRVPSDQENRIWLGLSLQRMVLAFLPLLTGLFAAGASIRTFRNFDRAGQGWQFVDRQQSLLIWGSLTGLGLAVGIACIPAYRFAAFQDYMVRLQPFMLWAVFFFGLTFLLVWGQTRGFSPAGFENFSGSWKFTAAVLSCFALIWALVAFSGLGLRLSEDYWYGTGVPILAQQVLIAVGFGVCFLLWGNALEKYFSKYTEVFLFFLIWGVAAVLWAREPVTSSYFAPGPYPPDRQLYPYSDAATFDIGSQFALIGQDINNGVFFDRALYMGFLVFLHAVAGQDYSQLMAVQAAIYAVLPALLYLLGRQVYSRPFGIVLAVLAALRGLNGIAAGGLIDLANQKQMLTDFPLAVLMVWLALVLVKWLKAPQKNQPAVLWAGGIIGLGVLIRTHALFPLLFVLFLIFIVYRTRISRALILSLLVVSVMFAAILPWGLASGGSVLDVLSMRIRTVIEERYLPNPEPVPSLQGNLQLQIKTQAMTVNAPQALPITASIASNFFHNLVTSVFILPLSPVFHEVKPLLRDVSPVWEQYWDGSLPPATWIFFLLNLFLVSMGIALAWRSVNLAGLVPLGLFLLYQLANGFARTSGGRYIVPVDWAVFFYYTLGLLRMLVWGLQTLGSQLEFNAERTERDELSKVPLWKIAPSVLLVFLFIGGLLPLSEALYPQRYPPRTQQQLISALEAQGTLSKLGIESAQLTELSTSPEFRILEGRILYPRFYRENKGEPKRLYPYMTLAYPRVGFTMIGPAGTTYAVLPQSRSSQVKHASDAVVMGCQTGQSMDALAVVMMESQEVLLRDPFAPFACPAPAPVCDGNGVCR